MNSPTIILVKNRQHAEANVRRDGWIYEDGTTTIEVRFTAQDCSTTLYSLRAKEALSQLVQKLKDYPSI